MKILFISLGCDKNLVDSEVMLGMLTSKGYEITDDENEADVVVVNTCCFIGDAKEESIHNILEMAELRKAGDIKAFDRNRLSGDSVTKKRFRRRFQKLMQLLVRLQ